MDSPSHTLHINADGTRYFLVPAGTDLTAGNFCLRSYESKEIYCEELLLLPYEVSREVGLLFLEKEFGRMAEETHKVQAALLQFRQGIYPCSDGDMKERARQEETAAELVKALLGEDVHGMSEEQKKELQEKMRTYFNSAEASQVFDKLSDKMEKLAQQLKKSPGAHGSNLQEILASLAAEMDDAEDAAEKEKNKAELQRKIRESIAGSLNRK